MPEGPPADVDMAELARYAARAMVAELRKKPGADDIGITVGDFATTRVGVYGVSAGTAAAEFAGSVARRSGSFARSG